jgi:predicted ATP-dependent endonuclease of OLD family
LGGKVKLKEVHVANFRNFRDSTPVQIQPDVTCLVGKNESGKTAFLHALYRLLPARENVEFSVVDHYPAWLEKRDRLDGKDLEKFIPIRAVFEFEAADVAAFEEKFGPETLRDRKLTLERNYEGKLFYSGSTDEHAAIRACLAPLKLAKKFSDDIEEVKTFKDGSAGEFEQKRTVSNSIYDQ